jgi:carboxypeptidase Q
MNILKFAAVAAVVGLSLSSGAAFPHDGDHIFSREEISAAVGLREAALENSGAYEILESITTEVGPRLAGSPGDAAAVAWMIAKLNELGFDKVWTEPVEIPHWQRGASAGRVLSPFPREMQITSLGLSVGTGIQGLSAEIIHFETYQDLLDAPEGAAEGKIVFISNRMERARDGSGYGPAVIARAMGPSEAARHGAVALLIRSIGTDSHRVPHTGSLRYADDAPRIPAAALSNPDADILLNMLGRGQPVRFELMLDNQDHPMTTSYNVIGEMTGSEAPDEVIIIGGHLDSWDLGTGAIDDGAGIAITMAAAKLIGDMPTRPRRTIRMVGWAAEEIGLWGGRQYGVAHADEIANHIIGAESDFGAGQIWRFTPGVDEGALDVMRAIHAVLAPLGIEWGEGNSSRGGPDTSAMAAAGMPAATLNQDGTYYFDLHHTADDTLDKVSAADLNQNVAAYAVFAFLAAQYDGYFDGRPE